MIQKPSDFDQIQESGSFRKLPMGGYVAQIKSVEDNETDQFLTINYDIVEGEYKGIAMDAYEKFGRWSYNFRAYYRKKALPFFKKFITRVEATNPGFAFDWNNPQCLVKRGIGLVIGMRQYWAPDGSLREVPDVQDYCTATEVREDNLPSQPKTREPKEPAPAPVMTEADDVTDDQLPF